MAWVVLLLGLLLVLPSHGSNYNSGFEDPTNLESYIDDLLTEYQRDKALRAQKQQQALRLEKQENEIVRGEIDMNKKSDTEVYGKDGFLEEKSDSLGDETDFAEKEETNDEIKTDKPSTTESSTDPAAADPLQPQAHKSPEKVQTFGKPDMLFIFIVTGCSVVGLVGLIMAGVCWYKLHSNVKAASDVEYPAYGVTGPTKDRLPSPGDRKLAQSAQMYHYQHQKQQMIALEKANGDMKPDASEEESGDENEEGDYTVYECPGLAPTGEMEVRNPLFNEDVQTPVNGQTPVVNGHPEERDKQ